MKKNIKTILFILIILFNAFFMFQNNINANYSGTGGTGSSSVDAATKDGNWKSHFGFYIKVYNQNGTQKGSTIDVSIGSFVSPTISKLKGWITYDGDWHTNPIVLYDYLNIPYGSVSGNYSTLLSKINITLSTGDYITIEPYTLIDNIKYTFREISDSTKKENICTEMKCNEYECLEYNQKRNFVCDENGCRTIWKNTTCKTYSDNCIKKSETECATSRLYNYYDWYAKPAVILANAAKVGSEITVGSKTFNAPTPSCNEDSYKTNHAFCGYKSNRNVGYGITVVRYEDIYKNGAVRISIKRSDTNQLIKTQDATFRIFDSKDEKITDITTKLGVVEYSLGQGTYKIQEIASPQGYNLTSAKSVNISITANRITDQDFYYDTTCSGRLAELGDNPSVETLINLYKDYPNNTNLLNFDNPSCGNATCDKENLKNTLGCLSGKKALSPTFNHNNLSCYDEIITDISGNLGFCSNYFDLTNNLGTSKFYGISGQFLIRQNNNVLTIYEENLDPVEINNQYIATAKNGKICYILNGNTYDISSNMKSINVYFANVDEDKQTDLLNSDVIESINTKNELGKFTMYQYELNYNYKLSKEIYLEKITGKYSSIKSNTTTQEGIYGILSKFNSSSGYIPFSITYNDKMYTSDKCVYETKKEIIKYDKTSKGNIELEFRSIDTRNPFSDRNTNTNWCDNENNNCASDNSIVEDVILNSNNSYNIQNKTPKYKIKLTPSDIKIIRKYNIDHPYDNYLNKTVLYNGEEIVRNSFLYDMEQGRLNDEYLSNSLFNLKYSN